jgi:5-histidylcysteine sulfoxide synthase
MPNPPDLRRVTPDEARAWVEEGWTVEDRLFSGVTDAALPLAPDALRRPLLFYLGHTASFFANKLAQAGLFPEPVHEVLDPLFAMGVDEMPGELKNEDFDWPSLTQVRSYRAAVRGRVGQMIDRLETPVAEDSPWWALFMSADHQRVHIETSAVLIRQLGVEQTRRPEGWADAPADRPSPPPAWVTIPSGSVRLGKPRAHPTFGWDIEYGERVAAVPAFRARSTLVTNEEFRAFVAERGYAREELWSAAGWRWRKHAGAVHPRFWTRDGDDFRLRTLFDVVSLPASWPVEVNWHEAQAYCRFAAARLPTEVEHHRLRQHGAPANLALAFGSPSPVDHYPAQRNGIHDGNGNVWQHVEDENHPLPGFRPHSLYPDYSRTAFDREHHMMLGGSFLSSGAMASPYARNWYRPHFHQCAGIRLVSIA